MNEALGKALRICAANPSLNNPLSDTVFLNEYWLRCASSAMT